jgi:hypothetical protein
VVLQQHWPSCGRTELNVLCRLKIYFGIGAVHLKGATSMAGLYLKDGLTFWKELWTPHRSQASKMLQLR